mmetsp:Transcript_17316/g.35970  ORF Transcript_17316/g.35970 Transcript_17316/m.35970 type:complete len:413 (-) Transcript_17316:458-1696(-)|eukprot:CAMPEP_0184685992 /NCGR_PEP_ID=MMETSP0312-20130426/20956_1 /TAXON_ID=31354 /ORGANISM="Compsopogon coeruleus, Strain SAG 36.94" /LENGTH=412 /DNA_ID=CAMNT_0027140643 /DNA_START=105 /DNA_END=1343 /DNA_ORIENTATION=-
MAAAQRRGRKNNVTESKQLQQVTRLMRRQRLNGVLGGRLLNRWGEEVSTSEACRSADAVCLLILSGTDAESVNQIISQAKQVEFLASKSGQVELMFLILSGDQDPKVSWLYCQSDLWYSLDDGGPRTKALLQKLRVRQGPDSVFLRHDGSVMLRGALPAVLDIGIHGLVTLLRYSPSDATLRPDKNEHRGSEQLDFDGFDTPELPTPWEASEWPSSEKDLSEPSFRQIDSENFRVIVERSEGFPSSASHSRTNSDLASNETFANGVDVIHSKRIVPSKKAETLVEPERESVDRFDSDLDDLMVESVMGAWRRTNKVINSAASSTVWCGNLASSPKLNSAYSSWSESFQLTDSGPMESFPGSGEFAPLLSPPPMPSDGADEISTTDIPESPLSRVETPLYDQEDQLAHLIAPF